MNAAPEGEMLSDSSHSPLAEGHAPPSMPTARSRWQAAVAALLLLAAIGVAGARAGSCRVLLALGSLDVEPSPAGLSVKVSGNWEFDNLIQVPSGLAFNLLLVRGDHFVRLRYPEQSFVGSVPGLAEQLDTGIDGNTVVAVEANGLSTQAARFVSLEAQRMKVTAPLLPGSGPLTAIVYLVLDGDYLAPIFSNTISRPLTVVGATPTIPDKTDPIREEKR
jgi:hypothetical protein